MGVHDLARPDGGTYSPVETVEAVGETWDGSPMSTSERPPSRLVDRDQQSWMLTADRDGRHVYTADMHRTYLTLDEVQAQHAPLRPVLPITAEDRERLRAVLAAAGRKAVTSLAAAVYDVFRQLREDHGGMDNPRVSYETATQHLLAGRPGSWESQSLLHLLHWSGDGKPSRIDPAARAELAAIIRRWVTDPDRYTEVAETLAAVVSELADEQGGWKTVADQWLQPGSLDQEGVRVSYGLLYSLGADFDPAVLG
jgi:hypothetical protein